MRSGWALVIVAALTVRVAAAHADAKSDVEALVKANLAAIAKNSQTAFDTTLRRDAYVYMPALTDAHTLLEQFYGIHAYGAKHKNLKLVVVADAAKKIAWFHAQWDATYVYAMMNPDGSTPRGKDRMRAVGVVLDDGKGWKIGGVMYGYGFPNKYLYDKTDPDAVKPTEIEMHGDAKTGAIVARWFDGQGAIAIDRAQGPVVVNGTGEAEYGTGSVATTMVKAWDRLKLYGLAIKTTRFGAFPIAMVKADVGLPVKAGGATKLRLAGVLVQERGAWKWTSLAWYAWYDETN